MGAQFWYRLPGQCISEDKKPKLWVFMEKDDDDAAQLVQAQALIDAMNDYAQEEWVHGPSKGTLAINLDNGRKGGMFQPRVLIKH